MASFTDILQNQSPIRLKERKLINPQAIYEKMLEIYDGELAKLDHKERKFFEYLLHNEAYRQFVSYADTPKLVDNTMETSFGSINYSSMLRRIYEKGLRKTGLNLDEGEITDEVVVAPALRKSRLNRKSIHDDISLALNTNVEEERRAASDRLNNVDFKDLDESVREDAVAEFLQILSLYTKTTASTNHPTDGSRREYKEAFLDFRKSLDPLRDLFTKGSLAVEEGKEREIKVTSKVTRYDYSTGDDESPTGQREVEVTKVVGRIDVYAGDANVVKSREIFSKLAGELHAPEKNLQSHQEIAWNTRASKRIFDAAGIMASGIATAISSIGLDPRKYKDQIIGAVNISAHTWNIDKDGKPNNRPNYFITHLVTQQRDINLYYIHELAKLSAAIRDDDLDREKALNKIRAMIWKRLDMIEGAYEIEATPYGVDPRRYVGERYRDQVWEFINKTLPKIENDGKVINEIKKVFFDRGFPDKIISTSDGERKAISGEIGTLYNQFGEAQNLLQDLKNLESQRTLYNALRKRAESNTNGHAGTVEKDGVTLTIKEIDIHLASIEKAIKSKTNAIQDPTRFEILSTLEKYKPYADAGIVITKPGYTDNNLFLEDLRDLEKYNITVPEYIDPFGKKSPLNVLDILQIQAKHGNFSQKGEYRQSSEVIEKTFNMVNEILKSEDIYKILESIGITPRDGRTFTSRELMDIINYEEPYSSLPKNIKNDERMDSAVTLLKDAIQKWVSSNITAADAAFARFQQNQATTADTDLFRVVDTLQELRIIANNSEAIPLVLIAECKGSKNLEDVLFLLNAMNDDRNGKLKGPMISPLLEYPKDIEVMPQVAKEIYENPHFREHNKNCLFISGRRPEKYDEKTGYITKIKLEDLINNIKDQEIRDLALKKIQEQLEEKPVVFGINLTEGKISEEELNRYLKNTDIQNYIMMVAGSDAFKSASTAIRFYTNNLGYKQSQSEILVYGVMLQKYLGCGSSVHRNHVTDALHTTGQGLELLMMSSHYIAVNAEGTIVQNAANQHNIPLTLDGKYPPELIAIHNLGNRANLPAVNGEETENKKNLSRKRIKSYTDNFHDSKDYARYFTFCVPHELSKLYEISARPPARIDSVDLPDISQDPKTGKANGIDPETQRAIGHNFTLIASGFTPAHLFYGVADYLGADKNGRIEDIDGAVKRFLKDPDEQDVINRAIWGIVHSDPGKAWEYVNKSFKLQRPLIRTIGEDGNVYIQLHAEGKLISLQDIADGNLEALEHFDLIKILSDPKRGILLGKLNSCVDILNKYTNKETTDLWNLIGGVINNEKFSSWEDIYEEVDKVLNTPDVLKNKLDKESDEYISLRKTLVDYCAERENIYGAVRCAARMDLELTKTTKSINQVLNKITGKKVADRYLASKDCTMDAIGYISPMLYNEYRMSSISLKEARDNILEQFSLGKVPKKPLDKDQKSYEMMDKYFPDHYLTKTLIGELTPVSLDRSQIAIAYAAQKSQFMRDRLHQQRLYSQVDSEAHLVNAS